jgi:ring-1,2-phenylacetyl-CoA epoxidase subunit PaaE
MATFHDLTVAGVDRLTEDALRMTLDVPPELSDAYLFKPGQHLTFRHQPDGGPADGPDVQSDDEIRRTFSICSPPSSGLLQVGVKLLPGGVFSSYVHEAVQPGTVLSVMTPVGRFVPRAFRDGAEPLSPGPHRYVAVCAGSGVTPVMSIMAALLESDPDAEFVLIFGNRRAGTVMFADEIADLKDRFPTRLVVYHVLSGEPHESPLLSGRIDRAKLDWFFDLHDPAGVDEWFLCGPTALVTLTTEALREVGVGRRQIHSELFWVGAEPPRPSARVGPGTGGGALEPVAKVRARLEGRTLEFGVDRGESVLDALLRTRRDAPYSCRGGVCGTCRMRVLAGEVSMRRNYALELSDLDAGFRLACQSDPTTPELEVDFDV